MLLRQLWLKNFRNYKNLDIYFENGTTIITGDNGNGKTNLVESIAWLANGKSFRGTPNEALVRQNEDNAIIRAEIFEKERKTTLEAQINKRGRNLVQVNGKKINKTKEIQEKIKVTLFSPDDLILIKGSPNERRNYIDELLVDLHPKNLLIKNNFEKALKQRNMLLKQAKGKLTTEIKTTLDVWDQKVAETGEELVEKRKEAINFLIPIFNDLLKTFSKNEENVLFLYEKSWTTENLFESLKTTREKDLRRGMTTSGPHRDDLEIKINTLLARNHSSQGEQRSLALCLRLAGHEVIKQTLGVEPIVLLDDVFSELDQRRCDILVELLPKTQSVLTTAGQVPKGISSSNTYCITEGKIK